MLKTRNTERNKNSSYTIPIMNAKGLQNCQQMKLGKYFQMYQSISIDYNNFNQNNISLSTK